MFYFFLCSQKHECVRPGWGGEDTERGCMMCMCERMCHGAFVAIRGRCGVCPPLPPLGEFWESNSSQEDFRARPAKSSHRPRAHSSRILPASESLNPSSFAWLYFFSSSDFDGKFKVLLNVLLPTPAI